MKTYLAKTFGSVRIALLLFGILLLSRIADMGTTYWFLSHHGWNYDYEANTLQRGLMVKLGFFQAATFNVAISYLLIFTCITVVQILFRLRDYSKRCAQKIGYAMFLGLAGPSFLVSLHNTSSLPFLPLASWDALFLAGMAFSMLAIALPDLRTRKKSIQPLP